MKDRNITSIDILDLDRLFLTVLNENNLHVNLTTIIMKHLHNNKFIRRLVYPVNLQAIYWRVISNTELRSNKSNQYSKNLSKFDTQK